VALPLGKLPLNFRRIGFAANATGNLQRICGSLDCVIALAFFVEKLFPHC
jgi:hypothetical protein